MADLSVRAPLDAEGLVDALFKRVDFRKAGFDTSWCCRVLSRIRIRMRLTMMW